MTRIALAGDTMLGREVARALETASPESLFAPDIVEIAQSADLFVLNLECCISARGERWPDPRKPFFFRAPPIAVEVLALLGVDCVTLANNHALDYGPTALLDTLELLTDAGIAIVGAGADVEDARSPAVVEASGFRLGVVGFTDHPADFAAGKNSPGVAYVESVGGLPEWVGAAIGSVDADAVLVTPHWGPNMVPEPVPGVLRTAETLGTMATLVAGHSAHVFHGVRGRILYDLGDFIDDYAVDRQLRNDLGLLFLVDFEGSEPVRLEAVPLKLEFCRTEPASGEESTWIQRRFVDACRRMGTEADVENGRLVVSLR